MSRPLLLLITILTALGGLPTQAGEIIVNPSESLHHALRQAREWRRTTDPRCEGGITITLRQGRYYMAEPLYLRPEDSGTPDSPTILRGEAGTVICGDPPQQHTQLWPKEGMMRMFDFDADRRTITIPTPPADVLRRTPAPTPPTGSLEMVVHQRWAMAILRVKAMTVNGDSTIVTFCEPESRLEFEHPWPQPVIGGERGSSSFLLRATEQRIGIEQLVVVDGASFIAFEGIAFENTCWNRPLRRGHVTLQAGFPLLDAYKLAIPGLPWDDHLENQAWVERPVSAVSVNGANVSFRNCHFRHLGATALDIESFRDASIEDCTFTDIGGTAILAGSFAESPREVHRPYADLADRASGLLIRGNTIDRASCEDWGAVAIGCGYVKNTVIEDNAVSHVNYSGICVGWGWTPHYTGMENNYIRNNQVSDYARQLYDAGGIYTLSYQPLSTISGNSISQPYPAPYATNDRAFTIYLDARTDGFTLEGNTTDGRLIRRNEVGDNHPGPNLRFANE